VSDEGTFVYTFLDLCINKLKFQSVLHLNIMTMSIQHFQINIPLSFKQVVDIVKQLSPSEKEQLSEVLRNEHNVDYIEIPEEHKQIVRDRIKKYDNSLDSYLSWDDIEGKISARK